jgi:hypothetical protein
MILNILFDAGTSHSSIFFETILQCVYEIILGLETKQKVKAL